PAIVLALVWRRFTSSGVEAGSYGGLASSLVLVFFSPVVSGKDDTETGESRSQYSTVTDLHFLPLNNAGIVTIMKGLASAGAGTYLGREKPGPERYVDLSVRALTGVGSH